jgi:hypothetical protein
MKENKYGFTSKNTGAGHKDILSRASIIEFEKEISAAEFGIGRSFSDAHMIIGGREIEIETKAGMEFFENLNTSNFMTQSGNSLMKVTNIEDYKVFLNPGLLIVDKQAAIKKVVDAWSKQEWFSNSEIINKFKKYGESKGFDFADGTVVDFLKTNTNWFDDIFINNIKQ